MPLISVIPATAGIHSGARAETGRRARRALRLDSAAPANGPRLGGRGDGFLAGGVC